ncbi:MAG: hypothetical protein ACN4GM_00380 [Gammaproteobacteria bacterium]
MSGQLAKDDGLELNTGHMEIPRYPRKYYDLNGQGCKYAGFTVSSSCNDMSFGSARQG